MEYSLEEIQSRLEDLDITIKQICQEDLSKKDVLQLSIAFDNQKVELVDEESDQGYRAYIVKFGDTFVKQEVKYDSWNGISFDLHDPYIVYAKQVMRTEYVDEL